MVPPTRSTPSLKPPDSPFWYFKTATIATQAASTHGVKHNTIFQKKGRIVVAILLPRADFGSGGPGGPRLNNAAYFPGGEPALMASVLPSLASPGGVMILTMLLFKTRMRTFEL